MAAVTAPTPKLDRYIVIHVATTCDEHGVYVTKDSAEVIELGWILLDTKTCEEVHTNPARPNGPNAVPDSPRIEAAPTMGLPTKFLQPLTIAFLLVAS